MFALVQNFNTLDIYNQLAIKTHCVRVSKVAIS